MRLCGISSRFQLLSPCTGQVTHALLTRPPLSHRSIIRRISKGASFDLHVLGTPPAFILSQDQTLKYNVYAVRSRSRTTGSFPVFTVYLGFELSFCSMDFPADITLRKTRMKFELTFKVVLLFSYQGFVFSFENA